MELRYFLWCLAESRLCSECLYFSASFVPLIRGEHEKIGKRRFAWRLAKFKEPQHALLST